MSPRTLAPWSGILCALWFALAGCSDSDGDRALHGRTSQRIAGATVCLDVNANLVCDEGEPSTTTQETGAYVLAIDPAQAGSARVLVVVHEDAEHLDDPSLDGSPYLLAAPKGEGAYVSAFTTLLAFLEVTETELKTAFALATPDSLCSPYQPGSEVAQLEKLLLALYAGQYRHTADDAATAAANAYAMAEGLLHAADPEAVETMLPPLLQDAASDAVVGDGQFVGVPMNDAFQFGRGLNEVTLEILPGTMAMAEIPKEKNIQANNTFDYYFHVVSSAEELTKALNIHAEFDLNKNMISGSAVGSYLEDMEKSSTSIFAFITVEAKTYYYDITGLTFANAQGDPSSYYPACNESGGAHIGDARYKYLCDYNSFAEIYGHRFLAGIQAGGRYMGLMRIDASSAAQARTIAAEVKGRYNNGAINISLKGSFQDHVASMAEKYNASFKVFTSGAAFDIDAACAKTPANPTGTGCKNGYLIDEPQKFFDYADQFIEAVLSDDGACKDKGRAWQECAYTASFADYSAIAGEARDAAKKERLNQAAKLMRYYRQFKGLQKKASEIYANDLDYLYDYTIFNFETFEDEQILVDPKITGKVIGYSTLAMDLLKARYAECLAGITCEMPWYNEQRKLAITAPSRLESLLPIPAQPTPTSCYDWQKTPGKDGNWAVVTRPDGSTVRYRIRCEKMDSSEPETYLDLTNNNSPSPESPTVNFSEWENADASTTTTIFQHLRIHPNVGKIALVQGQDLWTRTRVFPEAQPDAGEGGDGDGGDGEAAEPLPLARFSEALAGKAADCFPEGVISVANLDLGNLPLRFSEEVAFTGALRSNYELGTEAVTWEVANANAAARGGHLLRIDSPDEWIRLVRLMGNAVGDQGQYWVDLKFEDKSATTTTETTTGKFAYKWGGVTGYTETTKVDCNQWIDRHESTQGTYFDRTRIITNDIYRYCTERTLVEPIFDIWEENWPQPYLQEETDTTTTETVFTRCAYYNATTGALRDDVCNGSEDDPDAGKRLYIIEYDYAATPLFTETWGPNRKSVTLTIDAQTQGACVDVRPAGPLWLVADPGATLGSDSLAPGNFSLPF